MKAWYQVNPTILFIISFCLVVRFVKLPHNYISTAVNRIHNAAASATAINTRSLAVSPTHDQQEVAHSKPKMKEI